MVGARSSLVLLHRLVGAAVGLGLLSSTSGVLPGTDELATHADVALAAGKSMELVCADPEPEGSPNLTSGNDDQSKCVAGAERSVRGFIRDCQTEQRAFDVLAEYLVGQCKGKVTFQAEAVAQARLIARLNAEAQGAVGEIGPGVQWEVKIPLPNKRIDVLRYDSEDATSNIELVELKRGAPGSTAQEDALDQLEDYRTLFPDHGAHQVVPMPFAEPYVDTFAISQQCDGVPTGDPVRFRAASVEPGVIMVQQLDPQPPRQRLLEGEQELECPIALAPEGAPEPPTQPAQDPCRPDWEAWGNWMRGAALYLTTAPLAAAGVVKSRGLALAHYVDVLIEGGKIADSAPDLGCDPTRPLWPVGGGGGDPHLTTLDGFAFDMQSVGEFEMLNAADLDLNVQARFAPWRDSTQVSTMERIAMTLNGFKVEMDSEDRLRVDGRPVTVPEDRFLYFNAGIFIQHSDGQYRVVVPNESGDFALLRWSKHRLAVRVSPGVVTSGLLGNNDEIPNNDLVADDGAVADDELGLDRFIHGHYARSWALQEDHSSFTYAPGESTATFTDPAFPVGGAPEVDDFPVEEVIDARSTCAEVPEGSARDGCVLDVLATGGTTFLEDALASQSGIIGADVVEFDESTSIDVDFESTVPHNFAPPKFGRDSELSTFVGPFKSGGRYEFFAPVRVSPSQVAVRVDVVAVGAMTQSRQRSVRVDVAGVDDLIHLATNSASAEVGEISRTGSGRTADGRPFVRYQYTLTTPPVGGTLLGALSVEGFSRLQSDSLGLDNIQVSLVGATPGNSRSINLGDIVQPGADGGATISARGQRDVYNFTVPAGAAPISIDELLAPDLQTGCDAGWRLTRVSTGRIYPQACTPDLSLPAGDYQLEVIPPADVDFPYKYGFHLHEKLTPQRFDATIGLDLVAFGPEDGTGAGVLDGSGGSDIYNLNITRAGILIMQFECPDAQDPNCVQFADLSDDDRHYPRQRAVDVAPGQYRLMVDSGSGRHRYRMRLRVADTDAHQLAFGDVIAPREGSDLGRITSENPRDRFEFDVPEGSPPVAIGLLPDHPVWSTSSYWYGASKKVCEYWTLTGPQGETYDACGANWSTNANELPAGTTRWTCTRQDRWTSPSSTASSSIASIPT